MDIFKRQHIDSVSLTKKMSIQLRRHPANKRNDPKLASNFNIAIVNNTFFKYKNLGTELVAVHFV